MYDSHTRQDPTNNVLLLTNSLQFYINLVTFHGNSQVYTKIQIEGSLEIKIYYIPRKKNIYRKIVGDRHSLMFTGSLKPGFSS